MENNILQIGNNLPNFTLKGVDQKNVIKTFEYSQDFQGKWLVCFFWPKNFSSICSLEVKSFFQLSYNLTLENVNVIGFSMDSEFCHLKWKEDLIKELQQDNELFQMILLSDIKGELSRSLNIYNEQAGVSGRATFIIDPNGIIRYMNVIDMGVDRDVQHIEYILKKLKAKYSA